MKFIKSRVWQVCLTVTLALYPLYVWWAVQNLAPLAALLPLAVIAFLRSISTSKKHSATRLFYLSTVVLLVIALSWRESERALLFYPVWINLGMLVLFGWSLLRPPSMVTQLANLVEGPLDAKAITYTTKVTKVWCVFFIVNGSIALGTASTLR